MAEVAKEGRIMLLEGCPLDSSYENTFYFASDVAQYSYFSGLAKFDFTGQQYSRKDRGWVQVGVGTDALDKVNYMMFQNTPYSSKWFYAFVDFIEYVNDSVSRVHYTLDVIQSYLLDFEFGECFVEREHTETDRIGEHTLDEGLETGELIKANVSEQIFMSGKGQTLNDTVAAVYTLPNVKLAEVVPGVVLPDFHGTIDPNTGLYSPVSIYYVDMSMGAQSIATLNDYINAQTKAGNTVVNITVVPRIMSLYGILPALSTNYPTSFTYNDETYVPKNNKLLTYPYVSLLLSNHQGQIKTYRCEDFVRPYGSTTVRPLGIAFGTAWSMYPSPNGVIYPRNYLGEGENFDEGISIGEFPQIAWSEDSYLSWWNANKATYNTALLTATVAGVANLFSAVNLYQMAQSLPEDTLKSIGVNGNSYTSPANRAKGALGAIVNLMAMKQNAFNRPDKLAGNPSTNTAILNAEKFGYSLYTITIKPEYAKVIDNFFTMFGYKVNTVKTPNLTNRPRWTYLKTQGCIIHARTNTGYPSTAEDEICSIFDKGIRVWRNPEDYGNYNLDNYAGIR